jgi:hypothetical protein
VDFRCNLRRPSSSASFGTTSGNYPLHFLCIILFISNNKSFELVSNSCGCCSGQAEHIECCKVQTILMRWWF